MKSILIKELNSFFSSPIGYLVVGVYLVINGLILWYFNGDFNILQAGFADLNSYFFLAPWIFLFLIPAITMGSFSDENNSGTIEILKTKPISIFGIVLGKFFGSFILVILAIVPTLIYVYSIYKLGQPIGNLNFGATLGSFIGLLFLASSYTAIGIFTSTFFKNQIVSFITSVIVCFVLFYGFELIFSNSFTNNLGIWFQKLGMEYHFLSISKGVLDTRDIVYFSTLTLIFLVLTKYRIENEK
jgi:ABC-2 type transport system permease protein